MTPHRLRASGTTYQKIVEATCTLRADTPHPEQLIGSSRVLRRTAVFSRDNRSPSGAITFPTVRVSTQCRARSRRPARRDRRRNGRSATSATLSGDGRSAWLRWPSSRPAPTAPSPAHRTRSAQCWPAAARDTALRSAGHGVLVLAELGEESGPQEHLDQRQNAFALTRNRIRSIRGHVIDPVEARLDVRIQHLSVGAGAVLVDLGDQDALKAEPAAASVRISLLPSAQVGVMVTLSMSQWSLVLARPIR